MKLAISNRNYFQSSFFLFIVVSPLISLQVQSANGEIDEKKGTEPTVIERAIGFTGLNGRWDAVKTWSKLAWMNFKPPDSRSGSMKEAASKSFETSKETVEKSAASAAKVAGEAVEKTTAKVKRTMSSDSEHEL